RVATPSDLPQPLPRKPSATASPDPRPLILARSYLLPFNLQPADAGLTVFLPASTIARLLRRIIVSVCSFQS
ncbi:MAG: hypothetical protein ABI451_11600, partial [Dokdonella sp.]